MTRKDIDTRHAPAAAGPPHSPRLTCPTAARERHAGRRPERTHRGKPMNAPAGVLRPPGERREQAGRGRTRRATVTPAPTAAAQQGAARTAEADMRTDGFEGVV